MKMQFRKPFQFLREADRWDFFAIISVTRVVTEYRIREYEGTILTGAIRKEEAKVRWVFVIDLWLFIINFNIPIWVENKR